MKILVSLVLVFASVHSHAQETKATSSINSIIQELLDQITIESGEKMDTTAVRDLFHHEARLAILNPGDSAFVESVSLDDFLELLMDPYYEAGYEEREITKVVEEFNGIAHVMQSFYGRDSEGEEAQGMNSYQLVFQENRWWIFNMLWTFDHDGRGLPEKYQRKD